MQTLCAERRVNGSAATRMAVQACAVWAATCLAFGLFLLLTRADLLWDAVHHPEGPNSLQHPVAIEFVTVLAAAVALVLLSRSAPSLLVLCTALYWPLDVPLWSGLRPFVEVSSVFRVLPGLGVLAGGAMAYLLCGPRSALDAHPHRQSAIGTMAGRLALAVTGLIGALMLVRVDMPGPVGALQILCAVAAVGAFVLSAVALVKRGWL